MDFIISVQDIRTSLGEIANRAETGESFTVVRNSKPVFRIVPIETLPKVREAPVEYMAEKRDATTQCRCDNPTLVHRRKKEKPAERDPLRRDPSLKGAVFHGNPCAPTDEADWPTELR